MSVEVLEYFYRVAKACCGKRAELLSTYMNMYEELSRFPEYIEGFHSKYVPDCTYKIASKMGTSYVRCYEAFAFSEFYDICSRYLPAISTLVSAEVGRNGDFISKAERLCLDFEECVNDSIECRSIKAKGVAATKGASRVFIDFNILADDTGTSNMRAPRNDLMLVDRFTRNRWLLDMLCVGEQIKDTF